MDPETRQTLRRLVLDEAGFLRLTLNTNSNSNSNSNSNTGTGTGTKPSDVPEGAWRRVVVRPVQLRGRRHLQFSYFDDRRDVTKNYAGHEAARQLDGLLDLPTRSVSVQTARQTLNVQITRSGKAILHRLPGRAPVPDATGGAGATGTPAPPGAAGGAPGPTAEDLQHNRRKEHPLPEGAPDALLSALGIADEGGHVRPPMRGKFTQVNEFLKLLEHSGALDAPGAPGEDAGDGGARAPLRLVDCASGASYLSFAAYHYLNDLRGTPATLVGVDVNADLVAKSNALAAGLGYEGIRFVAAAIADFAPEAPPDVVLALHACDTATDEAIARGIAWGARAILAVPCCQHELQAHLGRPAPYGPVLRHGILRERLADILTDAFRAQILRLAGYDTDVVEFVSSEHSGRNLLIRAVRRGAAGAPDGRAGRQRRRLAADYDALKALWGVTPYLES
ncbi:MAG TPA: SAM-dependent methyltransferase, partial [Chloroflexota bacterium]|nr:SAM-dependent methyltransferase [Chloroflexota bacterium]